jgi:2-dehydro-3-deoxyphosphogluconate aldolase / (4S)-4-hydroxy-2-oxoglutarate aldolase
VYVAGSGSILHQTIMLRDEVVGTILRQRVIAIVRLRDAAPVIAVMEAIHAGGIRCIEISLTTPGALEALGRARARLPDAFLGVGTVTSIEDAEHALEAGAQFLVTPVTLPELVPVAHERDAPVAMGALTPTEVHAALGAGADLVKLFPASAVDPAYVGALLGPLPRARIVPTGGVDLSNARAWLSTGAVALGVGGGLTDAGAIAEGRFDDLRDHAHRLLEAIS